MKKIRELKQETKFELIFLTLVGIFLFSWALLQPKNFSPDEAMRFQVVDYIFKYNRLPHGGDPEVMNYSYGLSYAFYPMLTYMVSYVFMKIVSIFTMDAHALVVAARMAEVLYGVATAWFTLKIGRRFFKGAMEKMFFCLVVFLPGAFILFTYVNCDSLALLATAMLIYSWIRGLEDQWSFKSCALVGVGVSVCALSYYNAYGVILATVVVFTLSILFCEEKRWNFKKLITRGLFITAIFLALAGWWYVRNYMLYDGDILGLNITTVYAEQYAAEGMKPSQRMTLQETPGFGVLDMLFLQPHNHQHNWMLMVYYSFLGVFGYMTVWPPEWIGKAFMVFFLVGLLGVLMQARKLFAVREQRFTQIKMVGDSKLKVTCTYKRDRWSKRAVFHAGMLITLILPNLLNIYNSYAQDYQPQGRYSMPMLIPLMYFMTLGIQKITARFDRNGKAVKLVGYGMCAAMIAFWLYCYLVLLLPRFLKLVG